MSITTTPDFSSLDLPALIPATELPRLLGGLYTKKTLANMRWQGVGPKALKIGRKVAHLRADVVLWLQEQSQAFDPDAVAQF